MNSTHTHGQNDSSDIEGLDKLSRRYAQLPQDEPPELLDLAILNSAHRALEKKPHWMKFGWLHGLTTAAVFVLAISLVLKQKEIPPVFENDPGNAEPISLQREPASKKQALEIQFDESRGAPKEKNEARQELLKSIPAALTPAGPAIESAAEGKATETEADAGVAGFASDSLPVKADRLDKDAAVWRLQVEEEIADDETDVMADSPETDRMSELNLSSQLPGSLSSEEAARAKTDSEPEQRLLEIIRLKQNGDETWITALESFRESYPDYPLPDELVK